MGNETGVGVIRLADVQRAYPGFLDDLPANGDLAKRFMDLFDGGRITDDVPDELMPSMTKATFLDACSAVYDGVAAIGDDGPDGWHYTEVDPDLSPIERYRKYSWGHAGGWGTVEFFEIPYDDPDAFESWLNDPHTGSDPFEIILSFRGLLIPRKTDGGWYFDVNNGGHAGEVPVAVASAIALYESGFPVRLSGAKVIRAMADGSAWVAFGDYGRVHKFYGYKYRPYVYVLDRDEYPLAKPYVHFLPDGFDLDVDDIDAYVSEHDSVAVA